jgi:hypothetical protein
VRTTGVRPRHAPRREASYAAPTALFGHRREREAQALLDERLRAVNAGATRPAASIAFGTFVEDQWNVQVLPTFKASIQHGSKTALSVHVLAAWRDADSSRIERLAIQQWVAEKFQ